MKRTFLSFAGIAALLLFLTFSGNAVLAEGNALSAPEFLRIQALAEAAFAEITDPEEKSFCASRFLLFLASSGNPEPLSFGKIEPFLGFLKKEKFDPEAANSGFWKDSNSVAAFLPLLDSALRRGDLELAQKLARELARRPDCRELLSLAISHCASLNRSEMAPPLLEILAEAAPSEDPKVRIQEEIQLVQLFGKLGMREEMDAQFERAWAQVRELPTMQEVRDSAEFLILLPIRFGNPERSLLALKELEEEARKPRESRSWFGSDLTQKVALELVEAGLEDEARKLAREEDAKKMPKTADDGFSLEDAFTDDPPEAPSARSSRFLLVPDVEERIFSRKIKNTITSRDFEVVDRLWNAASEEQRNSCDREVCRAWLENDQPQKAERFILAMPPDFWRTSLMESLIHYHVQKNHPAEAIRLAETFRSPAARFGLLTTSHWLFPFPSSAASPTEAEKRTVENQLLEHALQIPVEERSAVTVDPNLEPTLQKRVRTLAGNLKTLDLLIHLRRTEEAEKLLSEAETQARELFQLLPELPAITTESFPFGFQSEEEFRPMPAFWRAEIQLQFLARSNSPTDWLSVQQLLEPFKLPERYRLWNDFLRQLSAAHGLEAAIQTAEKISSPAERHEILLDLAFPRLPDDDSDFF